MFVIKVLYVPSVKFNRRFLCSVIAREKRPMLIELFGNLSDRSRLIYCNIVSLLQKLYMATIMWHFFYIFRPFSALYCLSAALNQQFITREFIVYFELTVVITHSEIHSFCLLSLILAMCPARLILIIRQHTLNL